MGTEYFSLQFCFILEGNPLFQCTFKKLSFSTKLFSLSMTEHNELDTVIYTCHVLRPMIITNGKKIPTPLGRS